MIYDGFFTSQVVVWDFFHQQYEHFFFGPHNSCKDILSVVDASIAQIHPGRWTWNLKITCSKRKIIFQTSIFGFQVIVFRGVLWASSFLSLKKTLADFRVQRRFDQGECLWTLWILRWFPNPLRLLDVLKREGTGIPYKSLRTGPPPPE